MLQRICSAHLRRQSAQQRTRLEQRLELRPHPAPPRPTFAPQLCVSVRAPRERRVGGLWVGRGQGSPRETGMRVRVLGRRGGGEGGGVVLRTPGHTISRRLKAEEVRADLHVFDTVSLAPRPALYTCVSQR